MANGLHRTAASALLAASLGFVAAPAFAGRAEPATTAAPAPHARVLPLKGQSNFRDLGGYVTADGRHRVRWGVVYRSGSLSGLSEEDYRLLTPLQIASVIDLRSVDERRKEPTRWQAGPVDAYAKDYASSGERALFEALMAPGATPESVKATMAAFYRAMPEQFADQYAEIFHRLAGRKDALLFHCTAGKDRTGLAAALVLSALGVSRETVLADYELTNRTLNVAALMQAPAPAAENDAYAFLRRLPPALVEPLMRADRSYLEAALSEIDAKYGSVEGYLKKALGVTDAELTAIRARLLEPVK